MGQNYFNTLPLRLQLGELGQCRFMDASEFDGVEALMGKKIVIVGCGAQGLHQGLNLRDSGLDVSYALREAAIKEKRQSWKNATANGFTVGTYRGADPQGRSGHQPDPGQAAHQGGLRRHAADEEGRLPLLLPRLQHRRRGDADPQGPDRDHGGPQVSRHRGARGVQARLRRAHPDRRPSARTIRKGEGWELAKAYACGTGGDRAGVLQSSFVAEVKSDLMGEQTILCGMLQAGSLLCYRQDDRKGHRCGYASKLIQYGWETITEALKHGGITNMMDRLSNPAKIKAFILAEEMKDILTPALREAHGRHHVRRFFQDHDGGLGQGRCQPAQMAGADRQDRLREGQPRQRRRSPSRSTSTTAS